VTQLLVVEQLVDQKVRDEFAGMNGRLEQLVAQAAHARSRFQLGADQIVHESP
jgi:hypothetical protein